MITFLLAEFLRALCIHDETVDCAKNKTNLRDSTAPQDAQNSTNQLFGLKRDLIRLIGNLCYQHCDNQDKVAMYVYATFNFLSIWLCALIVCYNGPSHQTSITTTKPND